MFLKGKEALGLPIQAFFFCHPQNVFKHHPGGERIIIG
jgi:hypothetical protein